VDCVLGSRAARSQAEAAAVGTFVVRRFRLRLPRWPLGMTAPFVVVIFFDLFFVFFTEGLAGGGAQVGGGAHAG
jgi:hypothetical protein